LYKKEPKFEDVVLLLWLMCRFWAAAWAAAEIAMFAAVRPVSLEGFGNIFSCTVP
jgi:hypothetical protein